VTILQNVNTRFLFFALILSKKRHDPVSITETKRINPLFIIVYLSLEYPLMSSVNFFTVSRASSFKKQPTVRFGMNQSPATGMDEVHINANVPSDEQRAHTLQQAFMHGTVADVQALLGQIPQADLERILILPVQGILRTLELPGSNTEPIPLTPIYWAATSGNVEKIQAVLDAIPNPVAREQILNQVDSEGRNILLDNVGSRLDEPMTQLLVANGARIANPNQGYRLLSMAIHYANIGIVQALLRGIPAQNLPVIFNQPNPRGRTMIQFAEDSRCNSSGGSDVEERMTRYEIIALLLRAYGANPNQLTQQFRNRMQTQQAQQAKILTNPNITFEKVAQAMQWFQQFPTGGGALNWQPLTNQCNTFLQVQLNRLTDSNATQDTKRQILERTLPIRQSGIPIDQALVDALGNQATAMGFPW
jgi:hypothetical protein